MMKNLTATVRHSVVFLIALLCVCSAAQAEDTVCIQCHGAQEGRLAQPVELWRDSIHAANGNSCHGCHGGDPGDFAMAMNPERGFIGVPEPEDIPAFCGRCHVGVLKDYSDSAHGQALGLGGPQCVTCHSAHDVQKASPDLINPTDCSRCHEYGRAEDIKAAVVETDGMISSLDVALAKLHRLGIDTKDMEGELFSARNTFHSLFHSVDVDKVRQQTSEVQQELDKVRSGVEAIEQKLSKRKLAGGIVASLFVFVGLLAVLIRKTYQEEE